MKKRPLTHGPSPTPGELDCLAVLWASEDGKPLKLASIHRAVERRREALGENAPAPTTISTHLRSLLSKGLITEMLIDSTGDGEEHAVVKVRTRGILTPARRSPRTGYRAAYEPGEVLHETFRGLAEAYPPGRRREALLDFARALDLPGRTIDELERFLRRKKAI